MSQDVIRAAMDFLALNIYSIPVPFRSKAPVLKGWEKLRLTVDDLDEHFSNGSNLGILLGVAPAHILDIDADCREALLLMREMPPPITQRIFGRASKRASHWLYETEAIFKGEKFCDTGEEINPKTGKMHKPTMIELRGTAQQTVAPPSVHESGEAITWDVCGRFGKETPANLLRYVSKIAAACLLVRHWPQSDRHEARWALESVLLRGGWADDQVKQFVEAVVKAAQPGEDSAVEKIDGDLARWHELTDKGEDVLGFPTLVERVGEKEAKKMAKWLGVSAAEHRNLAAEFDTHLTDMGNAIRLARRHGNDLRHADQFGWMVWNGKFWERDELQNVTARAKDTVLSIYAEAAAEPNRDKREALAQFALESESAGSISAMISLARSEPGIPVHADKFDAEDFLLNCKNGTVDLVTGDLLPHDKDHLITKMIPVAYDPEAKCEAFDRFLSEIMCGNQQLVEYLWRLLGYSLTGSVNEQCWNLFLGEGENGKSTLLSIFRELLGPYAAHVNAQETFVAKQAGAIRNDLARLRGARLITAIEVEKQLELAESLMKQVTGEDPITCRFLRREHFEFYPKFKVVIAANKRPIIRGRDHAVWRRVRSVPFDFTVTEKTKNKNLAADLKAELPGILAHAVRACLDWQLNGLQPPEAVQESVKAYRAAMDGLKPFFDECCIVGDARWDVSEDIYKSYVEWHGETRAMARRAFNNALKDRNFVNDVMKIGGKSHRIWKGLELAADIQARRTAEREVARA